MASWWRRILRRRELDRQLEAELSDHMERQVRDYMRTGLSETEARRRARLDLGGVEQVKEECRDVRGTRLLEELVSDVRYGCRLLRRSPGFTVASLTVLALGIGANTAIFTLLESALLRRVPVTEPQQLYFIAHRSANGTRMASNYPFLERVRALGDVFSGVTAFTMSTFKVAAGTEVERVNGEYVSGNYHGLLGVRFSAGRGFTSEDDRSANRAAVAAISDGYWARRFGRRPDILGQTVVVDRRPLAIVGVTARGFGGFTPGRPADITLPLSLKTIERPEYLTMHDTWTSLTLIARLKPGVTEPSASAALQTVFRQYLSEAENKWYKAEASLLLPAGRGSDGVRRQYRASLGVLMAMVVVVLIVACSNIASLLLARGSARTKEVALRLAMGAGRGRLVRQFLTESLLLAVTGGALGFLLARWGTVALASLFRVGQNPVVLDLDPNLAIVWFTVAVSIATAIAFGFAPAFRATRVELTPALKENGGYPHRSGWTGRQLLVVGQLALCGLLVSGAGLLVRTLHNLQASDGSFNSENVLLFSMDTAGAFPIERMPSFCGAVLERLRVRTEVVSASCSTSSPADSSDSRRGAVVDGSPAEGGVFASVITPGYFHTFGIGLVRGRAFTPQDTPTSPKVGIINERLARAVFGDRDPVGRTFVFRSEAKVPIVIVGVAHDVPQHSLRETAPQTVYTPLGQGGEVEWFPSLALRFSRDPATLVALTRAAVHEADPGVGITDVRTMSQQLDAALVRERVLATLSTAFSVLALILASLGLYALMSYDVVRRRREIAIRLALGARPAQVVGHVLRDTAILAGMGIALGLVATFATTRVLSSLLFGLSSRDPLTLAATTALLIATTLAAGYIPGRRAAHTDPTQALRAE
jgi:predicted permease